MQLESWVLYYLLVQVRQLARVWERELELERERELVLPFAKSRRY